MGTGVLPRLAVRRRLSARLVGVLLATIVVAGCDKCGNRLKFQAPSLPDACGENADPAK